jgi:hypothetical protein
MDVLLKVNGFTFRGDSVERSKLLENIANPEQREQAIEKFEQWMRQHIVSMD